MRLRQSAMGLALSVCAACASDDGAPPDDSIAAGSGTGGATTSTAGSATGGASGTSSGTASSGGTRSSSGSDSTQPLIFAMIGGNGGITPGGHTVFCNDNPANGWIPLCKHVFSLD